jgi:hypothetical protein
MLSGSHCPESSPDKQDQEASAPVFDRSEGIETPIDGKGDYKGENGNLIDDEDLFNEEPTHSLPETIFWQSPIIRKP